MNEQVGHLTTTYARVSTQHLGNPSAIADWADDALELEKFENRKGKGTYAHLSRGAKGFVRILGESADVAIILPDGTFYKDTNSCNPTKSGKYAAEHLLYKLGDPREVTMLNMSVPVDPRVISEAAHVHYERGVPVGKRFCALISGIPDGIIGKEDTVKGKFQEAVGRRFGEYSLDDKFNPGITVENVSSYGHSGIHTYQEHSNSCIVIVEDLEGLDVTSTLDALVKAFRPKQTVLTGPAIKLQIGELVSA